MLGGEQEISRVLNHPVCEGKDLNELLANPAVQSGAAPFLAGVIVAFLLRGMAPWNGLALVAAFAIGVWLSYGFTFSPLTSTRKFILLTLLAPLLAILFSALPMARTKKQALLIAGAVAAVLWMLWPVLLRKEFAEGAPMALGLAVYAAWWMWMMLLLEQRSQHRAASAVMAGALGSSLAALFGASALLGQLAGALTAGAAAILFSCLIGGRNKAGGLLVVPAGLAMGMLGAAMTVYAKVPAYALLLLALVPLMVRLPLSMDTRRWQQIAIWSVAALLPALFAVFLTWSKEGPVPF